MNPWNAFSTLIQKQPTWPRYLASNFFYINWLLNSYLYNYQFTKESLRQRFQVNDSNWNRVISDVDRPRVSTQLLGTVPFGNAKRSNWVFFRIRTQLEPSRGKWWNDASKWVRIGSKRSSKKIDWLASSALYCLLEHLLGRFLLRSCWGSFPNGAGLVEAQGLSVLNC